MRHSSLISKQRGIGASGAAVIALIVGFIIWTGFQVAPPYFNNIYIRDALRSLGDLETADRSVSSLSNADIRSQINNYYNINGVRGKDKREVEIDRRNNGFYVNINYEVRIPYILNVDLLFKFENQFDSANPKDCCKPVTDAADTDKNKK